MTGVQTCALPIYLPAPVNRWNGTVRPKFGFEVLSRGLYVGERLEELEGADRCSAHLLALTGGIIQQALLLCQEKKKGKYGKNERK